MSRRNVRLLTLFLEHNLYIQISLYALLSETLCIDVYSVKILQYCFLIRDVLITAVLCVVDTTYIIVL